MRAHNDFMANAMTGLVLEILNRGLDDWVSLAEVEYLVREAYNEESPSSIKGRCLSLIEHLLVNGLVSIGDLVIVDGVIRFVAWGQGADLVRREMEQRWLQLGGPMDENGANDVCWLSNTEAGDAFSRDS